MRHVGGEGKPGFDAYTSGELAGATSFFFAPLQTLARRYEEETPNSRSRSSGREAAGSSETGLDGSLASDPGTCLGSTALLWVTRLSHREPQ